MKTAIAFIIILLLCTGSQLQATKPIPSYKTPISRAANFTEKNHSKDLKSDPKGRRYMMVVAQVAGPSKDPIFIWIYTLDNRTVLGPYTIIGSGELTVPIDYRLWGVLVECDVKTVVSVWTDPPTAE